jgi:hypothetical protein
MLHMAIQLPHTLEGCQQLKLRTALYRVAGKHLRGYISVLELRHIIDYFRLGSTYHQLDNKVGSQSCVRRHRFTFYTSERQDEGTGFQDRA